MNIDFTGQLCGTDYVPQDLTSSGNEVNVKFVTDKSSQSYGFLVFWKEIGMPSSYILCHSIIAITRQHARSPQSNTALSFQSQALDQKLYLNVVGQEILQNQPAL